MQSDRDGNHRPTLNSTGPNPGRSIGPKSSNDGLPTSCNHPRPALPRSPRITPRADIRRDNAQPVAYPSATKRPSCRGSSTGNTRPPGVPLRWQKPGWRAPKQRGYGPVQTCVSPSPWFSTLSPWAVGTGGAAPLPCADPQPMDSWSVPSTRPHANLRQRYMVSDNDAEDGSSATEIHHCVRHIHCYIAPGVWSPIARCDPRTPLHGRDSNAIRDDDRPLYSL